MKSSVGLPDRLVNGTTATIKSGDSEAGGSTAESAKSVIGIGFGPEGVDEGFGLGTNGEDSTELGVI